MKLSLAFAGLFLCPTESIFDIFEQTNHMAQPEKDRLADALFARNLISDEQRVTVKAYHSLGIFSLRNELSFLLYTAVLLFTSGIGILIYQNIDSIGHMAILALILAMTGICFYFCFKKSPTFRWEETFFESPTYDYLVLLATILSCIFIGYVQVQYEPFGKDIGVMTLLSAAVALFTGYYFDNRSALSIGVTGLVAFVGITITPRAVIDNNMYTTDAQTYTGIALAVFLAVWAEYSWRKNLKKHFRLVFDTFALHLAGLCCIKGMFEPYWFAMVPILAGACFYFYRKSHEVNAISLFVFALVYGYIGVNILLFKFIEATEFYEFFTLLTILAPVYFIGSIFLFIKLIKQFNHDTDDRD